MTQQKAETKHTPGPWHRGCMCPPWTDIITVDEKTEEANGLIARVYPPNLDTYPNPEVRANAYLIAAAPDLLAALDYLLAQTVDMDLKHGIELTEGETEARTLALAAIAKATNPKP